MKAIYDIIGVDYAALRKPDPRIAAQIDAHLGDASTVLNVGAGTGNYEPLHRRVTAVEPSIEMIRQRSQRAERVVQASAEDLPFENNEFDAAMAVLTVHHWPDKKAGLQEMRRVARGSLVIVTFDPASRPWLTDYIPELSQHDERQLPRMCDYADWLGNVEIHPLNLPHDCVDGFLYAYWRRPEAYLEPRIRSGSSSFWTVAAERGLEELRKDLESGAWAAKYADLYDQDRYDAGYRIVVAT